MSTTTTTTGTRGTTTATVTTTTQQGGGGGGGQTTTTTGNAGTQPGFIQVSGIQVATIGSGASGLVVREVLGWWVGGIALVGGVLFIMRV